MVLGYLLYEVVDLGVAVVKLTYDGTRALYYWWRGIEYPEVQRQVRQIEDTEELNRRLENLEKILAAT